MANDKNAGRKRKLSELEEESLLVDWKGGMSRMELSWKYKVSETTVYRITKRTDGTSGKGESKGEDSN